MTLVIDHVTKAFDTQAAETPSKRVLDDVSLEVRTGEFLTVIGPSGCGKSTLLSCIAGFTGCSSGRIIIDDVEVAGPGPGRAVVFQQASLLPWRTVAKNTAYGLSLQRTLPRREIPEHVDRALKTVGLEGYAGYFPHQLSGGMQQRVNLARALATRPQMLLMDEPFGALDAITKETLQDELLGIVRAEQCTTIFITHDIDEAVFLGDRVVVMSPGPGRIRHVRELPFGRPRDRSLMATPAFGSIVQELRQMLHATPAAPQTSEIA
jgi:NitT/TauT family transport system ATP-binding protein